MMYQFYLLVILFVSRAESQTNQACSNKYGAKLNGECKLVDECTGAALIGDCRNAQHVCCVRDTQNIWLNDHRIISRELFLKIVGNTTRNNMLYGYFVQAMYSSRIDDEYKAAAFLSTLAGETNNFKEIEARKGEPGLDGELYRGRGAILLRGKRNYELANRKKYGSCYDLIQNPERAAFPSCAFQIGSWFWNENAFVIKSTQKAKKESLNTLANGAYLDYVLLTHSLTNMVQSLKQRSLTNEKILKELGKRLRRGEGVECKINSENGYAVPMCMLDFKRNYCGCNGKDKYVCPYGLNKNNTCRNPPIIHCCVEKCKAALDMVVLMDSSGSIGDEDFEKEKKFVNQLVSSTEIGLDATRVAIINFSSYPEMVINLANSINKDKLIDTVNSIVYDGGGTNTADALLMANEILNVSNGMRPVEKGVAKIVVVVTDGASNSYNDTIKAANVLKARGINIVSVGIGDYLNKKELEEMATSIDDQFLASDFEDVFNKINSISVKSCEKPAPAPVEVVISTNVENNNYKYFKFDLLTNKKPAAFGKRGNFEEYLENFTVELLVKRGDCELFFSFDEENPKDENSLIKDDLDEDKEYEENFQENDDDFKRKYRRRSVFYKNDEIPVVAKLYQIQRPKLGLNKILYMSVKGMNDEKNEFDLIVHNRTISRKLPDNRPISIFKQMLNLFKVITSLKN